MIINTINSTTRSLSYKFVSRWLFSTNHKCGVLAFFVLGEITNSIGACIPIKLAVTYLKYSKKVKRSVSVDILKSLVKRTPIMTSFFGEACCKSTGTIPLGYSSTLLCGGKGTRLVKRSTVCIGYSAAASKGLGETLYNGGHLKYDYKSGFVLFYRTRSGMCGKLNGSSVWMQNVTQLLYSKRDFYSESGGSHDFKNLVFYKKKCINLTEIMSDVGFLQGAYQKIKSNPGVMARGSSNETLDGLNENWFIKTSERFKDGSFQFKPARRLMILKPNKPGKSPLTISDSRDEIVQQAMKMVLEQIYEPKFLETSHGFRPFKGCHSALESIRMNWTGISWFLEFDVEKCYDSINRKRLVSILKEDIEDQRFMDLISKLFNVGVLGWNEGEGPDPGEGISQGSVLSPLLANIYLHKLDVEVASICSEYHNGKIRRVNKDAINAERRILRKKDFKKLSPEKRAAIMSKHRAERRKLGITCTDWNDSGFIRVRYVRYADDLLMGIAGPKELVVKIRKRIVQFTESNLKLNLTGGKITHIGAGKVKFLGVWVSGVPYSKFPRRFGKALEKKKRAKNRLLLFKRSKEKRLLKVVDHALKKGLKSKRTLAKDPSSLKNTVEELKSWILQDQEFSKGWINSYQEFILAVTKSVHFIPSELKEDMKTFDAKINKWESEITIVSEEPKAKYKELVGRYDALPPQISAPLEDIRDKLRSRSIISKSNKPKAIGRLIHVPDEKIVQWYNAVGRGLLNYYCCCNNFYRVKSYVDYMVRWSAIHTLAGKHKSSSKKIIEVHTKDLIIKDREGFELTRFLSSLEIRTMRRRFRTNVSQDAFEKVLNQIWAKFTRTKFFGVECSLEGCENSDIEWHHVSELNRMEDNFGNVSVVTKKGKRVTGMDAFRVAFNRKQFPLCKTHRADLHKKRLSFSEINWDYVKEVS